MSESDTTVLRLTNPALKRVLRQRTTSAEINLSTLVPAWKRALDISLIILMLPILVPLGLLIGIIIKCVSQGPVLFKQERIGLQGRRFLCLKFRTMRVNADTSVHQGHLTELMTANRPMTKLDSTGDPRVIPGGKMLRALGLDELPQILNVLQGDMSLVGPRPCVPYEYEKYTLRHRQRFGTLPGLTGWWQVNGKNRTTFEQMMDLDIYYVHNKSLSLDLKIIAGTIPAIIRQVCDMKLRKKSKGLWLWLARLAGSPLDPQF